MLYTIGINHKTATLAVREKLSVAPGRIAGRLDALLEDERVSEAVLLTTCNRIEVYAVAEPSARHALVAWLGVAGGLFYVHEGDAAARHLFRVSAGLDSMAVGEAQILGQVKSAYLAAHRACAVGPELHRLFQHALEAAKALRSDGALDAARSLPRAAARHARETLGNLADRTALLVGAGETVETLAFHLHRQGIGRLLIANRSLAAAERLAMTYGGQALALEAMPAVLARADLVATATAAERPIINRAAFSRRTAARPLLVIDLAVPRDVAPGAGALPGVRLVTLDELADTLAGGGAEQPAAVRGAERAVDQAVAAWRRARRVRTAVPTICAMRARAADLRRQTLAEARRMAATRGSDAALEYLASTLTNRLTHAPTVHLREAAADGDRNLIEAAQTLLELDSEASETKRPDGEAA